MAHTHPSSTRACPRLSATHAHTHTRKRPPPRAAPRSACHRPAVDSASAALSPARRRHTHTHTHESSSISTHTAHNRAAARCTPRPALSRRANHRAALCAVPSQGRGPTRIPLAAPARRRRRRLAHRQPSSKNACVCMPHVHAPRRRGSKGGGPTTPRPRGRPHHRAPVANPPPPVPSVQHTPPRTHGRPNAQQQAVPSNKPRPPQAAPSCLPARPR